MGFKKNFFKNIAVYGGYSYIAWFFDSLISTIILSRFLGPKEYGFVALIGIFSGFIQLFSNTGLSYAVIRSNYGYHYHKMIYSFSIWVGLSLSILMCVLAYPITLIYGNKELFWPTIIIAFQFFTNAFNIVPLAILEKRLEFNFLGLINLIVVIITIILMIAMAILGFSYWSLIVPFVIQPVIRQIFLERKLKFGIHIYGWRMTRRSYAKVKSLFESLSIFNFVNYFARNADNFAVGKFYGDSTLGLYDRAYKFLYMARRLINSILGPVLYPSLIDERSKGEDIKSHLLDILGMINIINLFIAIPLIVLAKPITLLMWGKDWIGVADFMPYVGAIIPLQILMIAANDLFLIDKKEKTYLTLGIPMSLVLIIGIAIGAYFSALHVIRFYAIAFALVQTPLYIYLGHYKILKFDPKQILKFWGVKILLTNGLIFSVWFGNIYITSIILLVSLIESIIFRLKDIREIYILIKNKLFA